MKTLFIGVLIALSTSLVSAADTSVAESRGVNIRLTTAFGKIDEAAARTVRQIIGYGIASGAVDTFTVYNPELGTNNVSEGQTSVLEACAEAGFNVDQEKFDAFIADLKMIKPVTSGNYAIDPVDACQK